MRRLFEDVLKSKQIIFQKNVETARLCTFRMGGVCDYLIEPQCIGDLIGAVMLCRHVGMPYVVIGRGSNLLFSDAQMPIALIRTTALNSVRMMANGEFVAACGVSLPRLARLAATRGYSDLAFACGIPGTLGGGICMNAGAHGKSLGEAVKWVKVLQPKTGEIRTLFNKELSFSYRNSIFQQENMLVLEACLALKHRADPDAISAQMRALLAHRAATQPLSLPSAGSVFRRGEDGVSMGKIIDELGLKGMRCGNAAVSEKHAGFIVNLGGARASDVCTLIDCIKGIVKRKKGFEPMTEIQMISGGGRI